MSEGEFDSVLTGIGGRLRALRRERKATLVDLSLDTGISPSMLSRLESGQRRPTLDVLLLLARAHQLSLDELVSAPIRYSHFARARPSGHNGMTVARLTDHSGGLQAYKIIVPFREAPEDDGGDLRNKLNQAADDPHQRTHQGRNWLCVLSGRLRIRLGNRDLTLDPGEVADFDTRTPHWYASADPRPAEILCVVGTQSEHVQVRIRSTGTGPFH